MKGTWEECGPADLKLGGRGIAYTDSRNPVIRPVEVAEVFRPGAQGPGEGLRVVLDLGTQRLRQLHQGQLPSEGAGRGDLARHVVVAVRDCHVLRR